MIYYVFGGIGLLYHHSLYISTREKGVKMDIVSTIFGVITSAITNFTSALGSALNGMTSLFYVEAANDVPAHMTFVGVLLLIAAGIGVVYFCFRLIKSLVSRA